MRDIGGHDPRQIDLVVVFALLILAIVACRFLPEPVNPPTTTAFIVPSQTVRW